MKILIYFGHPAQYLFLKETMRRLQKKDIDIKIIIKSKDILETLLQNDKQNYINILPVKRGHSSFSIVSSLIKRIFSIYYHTKKFKPSLMIGTDASIAIVGKLFQIHRITITEDDYDVIKMLAQLTYPLTQSILCPNVCDVGKWSYKKVGYDGYMKLGYLHPNIFKKNKLSIKKYKLPNQYALIRLAKLTAYHDKGIAGIDAQLLDDIIVALEKDSYQVFISSESTIQQKYEPYLLQINPSNMHQVLAHSSLFISDSQSMSVEAALLGIPSIRISSKISVLEELEHKYKLTFGINPNYPEMIISKLNQLMSNKDLQTQFKNRQTKLFSDKIDVTAFLAWFLEHYPNSRKTLLNSPHYLAKFK